MILDHVLPTDDDVRFFEENGHWASKKAIDDNRLEELREAMDRLWSGEFETGHEPWSWSWNPGDDPLALRKMDNAHWANMAIRRLAMDETIGAMAARLMDTTEVRLWHDQLLYKPGTAGAPPVTKGNVGWHQDHGYWQCTTQDLITAWVAFDDVTVEKGSMHFVPGSNKWGMIDGDFFNTDLDSLRKTIEEKTGHEFRTVPCELEAGEVSFHHCLTLHASGPNVTDQPRRSLVMHVMPQSARYVGGTPSDGHQCAIMLRRAGGKEGDLFAGQHWPALYPRSMEPEELVPGLSHRQIIALGV